MDLYLVHGDEYKALRDAVGKAMLECKPLATVADPKVGQALGLPLSQMAPLRACSCLICVR